MLKRIAAMVLALSFIGMLAMAPNADARRGGCLGGIEDPVNCHPEV